MFNKLKTFLTRYRWLIVGLAVVFVAVVLIKTVVNGGQEELASNHKIPEVEVLILNKDTAVKESLNKTGTVKADSEVDVASETMGKINQINFSVGDEVKAGDILATLDVSSAQSSVQINYQNALKAYQNAQASLQNVMTTTSGSVQSAKVGWDIAQSSYDNASKAYQNTKTSTESLVNQAKASTDGAEIALETAKAGLSNTGKQVSENMQNTYDSALNTINTGLSMENSVLQTLDNILGVDNEDVDDAYEKYISARNPQYRTDARNYYEQARAQYNVCLGLVDDLSGSYQESSFEGLLENLDGLGNVLNQTIQNTDLALKNSFANADFSQATLDGLIASALAAQANHNGANSSFTGASQSVSSVILQNSVALENAGLAVSSAQKGLASAQAAYTSAGASAALQADQARAALDSAKLQLDNAQIVYDQSQSSAKSQVDLAGSQLDAVKGQYDLAKLSLSKADIRAPIDGKISSRLVDVGQNINAGTPVAVIVQTDAVKVEVDLSAEEVGRVKIGDDVEIKNGADSTLAGRVARISPAADVVSKFAVEILATDPSKTLKPGIFVDVNFLVPIDRIFDLDKNIYYIPLDVVRVEDNGNFVMLVGEDNKAAKKPVKLGKTISNLVEIREGLQAEDKIIITNSRFIKEGQEVKILK